MTQEARDTAVDEVLGRRTQLEQRLARATRLEKAVKDAVEGVIFDGLTLDQIDQDGVLQQSLKSLVMHASQQVPELDVVLYRGPHSPWGLRIVVSQDDVRIMPVQVGASSTVSTDEPAEETAFDFSKAAELAAKMWQAR